MTWPSAAQFLSSPSFSDTFINASHAMRFNNVKMWAAFSKSKPSLDVFGRCRAEDGNDLAALGYLNSIHFPEYHRIPTSIWSMYSLYTFMPCFWFFNGFHLGKHSPFVGILVLMILMKTKNGRKGSLAGCNSITLEINVTHITGFFHKGHEGTEPRTSCINWTGSVKKMMVFWDLWMRYIFLYIYIYWLSCLVI